MGSRKMQPSKIGGVGGEGRAGLTGFDAAAVEVAAVDEVADGCFPLFPNGDVLAGMQA